MLTTFLYILSIVLTAPKQPVVLKPPVYYSPPTPPPPPPIYIWVGYRDNNYWKEPTEDYDGDSS